MREVAAENANPVKLYTIGTDSSVKLHLAIKAFYPSKPPFPLMHVDTDLESQGDDPNSAMPPPGVVGPLI